MMAKNKKRKAWGFATLPPWVALAVGMQFVGVAAPSVHAMQSSEVITQLDNLIEQLENPSVDEQQTGTLSDQEIQQYLYEFTEQKSKELGWTEAWEWWREIFHTPGLRQIIRDYVFDKDE
ncbi:MAG: hypothetical protein AAF471_09390, partial [Myxococcota bacterium]